MYVGAVGWGSVGMFWCRHTATGGDVSYTQRARVCVTEHKNSYSLNIFVCITTRWDRKQ